MFLSCRSISDALKGFSAEAILLAFSTLTCDPQYGHVRVFCSVFAISSPAHLLHAIMSVRVMFSFCPKGFSSFSFITVDARLRLEFGRER